MRRASRISWSVGVGVWIVLAACYSPRVSPGAPCSPDGTCPSELVCIAGTCEVPGTTPESDAASDPPPDAPRDAAVDTVMVAPDAPVDAFVDTSLIAHWKLDDSPTDGVLDSSGRNHTGTCANACPTLVAGRIGMAYQFNAASGHAIVVPDSLDFRGSFTLAAWIRVPSITTDMAIMSKPFGTDSANSWQLELLETAKLSFSGGTNHYLENPAVITANTWHHVAGTWNGTTKRLYVNGALVATVSSSISYEATNIFLGADQNSGTTVLHWTGLLDDLRIYNRVLTASEIETLAE